MRLRALGTRARKRNSPTVGRGQLRAADDGHLIGIKTGHIMQALDGHSQRKLGRMCRWYTQRHRMTKCDPFKYFKTSPEIIRLAVMMYVRYPLSRRNVEDLLHKRGIDISHETVHFW
jgi:hypothetical protein